MTPFSRTPCLLLQQLRLQLLPFKKAQQLVTVNLANGHRNSGSKSFHFLSATATRRTFSLAPTGTRCAVLSSTNMTSATASDANHRRARLHTSGSSAASVGDGSTPEETSKDVGDKQDKVALLKQAVKDYGSTVIVFHVGISLVSLGFFYAIVSR